jgi:hypothetical protein
MTDITTDEIDRFCKEFFKNPINRLIFERLSKI